MKVLLDYTPSSIRIGGMDKYSFCNEIYFVIDGKIRRRGIDSSIHYQKVIEDWEASKRGLSNGNPIVASIAYAVSNDDFSEYPLRIWVNEEMQSLFLHPRWRNSWERTDLHRFIEVHYFGTNDREYIRKFNQDETMTMDMIAVDGNRELAGGSGGYAPYDYFLSDRSYKMKS